MRKMLFVISMMTAVLCLGTTVTADPADRACNELKSQTPGLFGLCVSFCEAHRCAPDFSAEDPFVSCPTGSEQVYRQYQKLRGPDDPDLPCLPEEETVCPCWNQEIIEEIVGKSFELGGVCTLNETLVLEGETVYEDSDSLYMAGFYEGDEYLLEDYSFRASGFWEFTQSPACQFAHGLYEDDVSPPSLVGGNVSTVTAEELEACRSDINNLVEHFQLGCIVY